MDAERLTTNGVHDTVPVAEMLDEQKSLVGRFYGDGIFDTWNLYETLDRRNVEPVVPPQRNAVLTHGMATVNCRSFRVTKQFAVAANWAEKIGRLRLGIIDVRWRRLPCFG